MKNIFNYCTVFCNEVAKIYSQQRILSIQIMGRCIFTPFQNFFHFYWRAKFSDFIFFLFYIKLCYATYGLETCFSYLGSIKHTSTVKQTISTSSVVLLYFFSFCFFFFFCLVGRSMEFQIIIIINNK